MREKSSPGHKGGEMPPRYLDCTELEPDAKASLHRLTELAVPLKSGLWEQVAVALVDRAPDDADVGRYGLSGPAATLSRLGLVGATRTCAIPAKRWLKKWRPQANKRPTQLNFRALYAEPYGDHASVGQRTPTDFRDAHYESLLGLQWAVNLNPVGRICAVRVEVSVMGSKQRCWEWRRGLIIEARERGSADSAFNCLAYLVDSDVFVNCRGKDLRWLPLLWTRCLPSCVVSIDHWVSVHPPLGSNAEFDASKAVGMVDGRSLRLMEESLVEGMSRVLNAHFTVDLPFPVGGVSVYKRRGMVEGPLRRQRDALGPLLLDPRLFFLVPTSLLLDRALFHATLQNFYGGADGPSASAEAYRIPVGLTESCIMAGTPLVCVAWLPICNNYHRRGYEDLHCPLYGDEDHHIRARAWYRVRLVSYAQESAVVPGTPRPVRGLVVVQDVDAFAIPGVEDVRFTVRSADLFWLTAPLAHQPIPRYYAALSGVCGTEGPHLDYFSREAELLIAKFLLNIDEPDESVRRGWSLEQKLAYSELLSREPERPQWKARREELLGSRLCAEPDLVVLFTGERRVILGGEETTVAELDVGSIDGQRTHWLSRLLCDPEDLGRTPLEAHQPLATRLTVQPLKAIALNKSIANSRRRDFGTEEPVGPPLVKSDVRGSVPVSPAPSTDSDSGIANSDRSSDSGKAGAAEEYLALRDDPIPEEVWEAFHVQPDPDVQTKERPSGQTSPSVYFTPPESPTF